MQSIKQEKRKGGVEKTTVGADTTKSRVARAIEPNDNWMKITMTTDKLSDVEHERWKLASELLDKGSYVEAIGILNELLTNIHSEPRLYAHRGYAKYRIEEYRGAVEDFSAALELKADAPNTLFLGGRCLEECEQFSEAVCDYDRVISLSPETADAHAQRGYCLEQMGYLEGARSAYERALEIDPQESLAIAGLEELG